MSPVALSDQQSLWGQLAAGFRALAADVNKGHGRTNAANEGLERAAVAFHPLLSLSTSMSRDMTKEFHWQAFLGHVRAAGTILQIRPNYILDQKEPSVITPLDSIYLPNDSDHEEAPGAVDIDAVAAGAPPEVLKRLIRERASAVARQCAAMSFRETVDRLREIEPINPILIASAIATSIVKGEDFRSLLRKYVAGEQIGPLENDWLALDFLTEEELSRVISAERLFVDAFTLLSLESILVSRYGHLYFPCKGQPFWEQSPLPVSAVVC